MRRWQTFSLFVLSELVCTKKHILAYFIILSTFSPHASSPLESSRRTEKILHPLCSKFFFFTERAGPYPQAQLYLAGRTMGWMANWTSLNLRCSDFQVLATTNYKTNLRTGRWHRPFNSLFGVYGWSEELLLIPSFSYILINNPVETDSWKSKKVSW